MIRMVFAFLIVSTMNGNDILQKSIMHYEGVDTYTVTLRSNNSEEGEIIRFAYQRPGFVRMEFERPYHGSVLVYNPEDRKVRIRPFHFFERFVLTLSPDNPLIQSSRNHRVDRSDIGALLGAVQDLANHGTTEIHGSEMIEERDTIKLEIKGKGSYVVEEDIHRYLLWFDKEMMLPLKVIAYDLHNERLEEVLMEDLRINVSFPEGFFDL